MLNLVTLGRAHGKKPEYSKSPLFQSPIINRTIILKHRVRSDETYLFPGPKAVATKMIVPFEVGDLHMGGRSFLVDQRGFRDCVSAVGNYNNTPMDRDIEVLKLIDAIPSLDPFLLREHLRAHDVDVGECYFDISPADRMKMYEFTAEAIGRLIELATGGDASGREERAGKLVSALLSNEVNRRLEPLREMLVIDGDDFKESVFSWRGFIYYKWSMTKLWPDVAAVVKDLRKVTLVDKAASENSSWVVSSKKRIIETIRQAGIEINSTLKIYDDAYNDLVERNDPKAFRDFLLGAPRLFLKLGDKLGSLSHLSSFWHYRFPPERSLQVDGDELLAIFQDFEMSFGLQPLSQQNVAFV